MKVKAVMNTKPDYIAPDASICQAALEMKKRDIGFLPIGDKSTDKLIGTLTDRDIAIRCVAQNADCSKIKVKDFMTADICYCFEDDDLIEAIRLMESKQVRRLVVLNKDKRFCGVVSVGDLAAKAHELKLSGEVLERICGSK
ncbi:MAG TPA: CBS domain-containing protein [Gammaproteobacteria bacterium]|nr:CBS domain-containing protein [Gammaproteobacteria bacterium]